MLLLGAMFIHGYSWTNHWAASQAHTYSLHGRWDDAVPFWAWTIWPYLALNLLYPLTFFIFPTRSALRRHALAIALVQAACMLAFVCWPTGNVRAMPQPDGASGLLFAVAVVLWMSLLYAIGMHLDRQEKERGRETETPAAGR